MHRLMRTTGLCTALAALLLAVAAAPVQAGTVYIYRDGVRCPLEVPEDFEFYEVERADIRTGNIDVIRGGPLGKPGRLAIGGSYAREGADTPAAEQSGRHGSGLWAGDYYAQRLLGPASWQEASGEYVDRRDWNLRLDQSTSSLSFDGQAFARSGYVYGFDANGDLAQNVRNRRFYDGRLRMGSMDGGTWRLRQTYMETGIGPGQTQAHDSRLWRTGAGFRAVECGWLLDAELYYGKYSSESALINNRFSGAKFDAAREVDSRLTLGADADVLQIHAGLDDKTVTRSNAAGRLDWQAADGLTLSGELRRVDEANDVVITSHLKGYTDIGGALTYAPGSRLRLSADYRRRKVDAERIPLEDPEIYGWYFDPVPAQRSDLDYLRIPTRASGDFYNLRGRVRFDANWQMSANYSVVDWSELPENGIFSGGQSLEPSYFTDGRRSAALRLSREYCDGGQLVFDASDLRRSNSLRDADYSARRYGASYSAPLTRCQRYSLSLSRSESAIDLTGDTQDWDSASWSFDAGLSGEASWTSYRLNYTRQALRGSLAGDYNALGLELNLKRSPFAISAWWRERADGPADGYAGYDDLGVRVGYSVALD